MQQFKIGDKVDIVSFRGLPAHRRSAWEAHPYGRIRDIAANSYFKVSRGNDGEIDVFAPERLRLAVEEVEAPPKKRFVQIKVMFLYGNYHVDLNPVELPEGETANDILDRFMYNQTLPNTGLYGQSGSSLVHIPAKLLNEAIIYVEEVDAPNRPEDDDDLPF